MATPQLRAALVHNRGELERWLNDLNTQAEAHERAIEQLERQQ